MKQKKFEGKCLINYVTKRLDNFENLENIAKTIKDIDGKPISVNKLRYRIKNAIPGYVTVYRKKGCLVSYSLTDANNVINETIDETDEHDEEFEDEE